MTVTIDVREECRIQAIEGASELVRGARPLGESSRKGWKSFSW
jgi:hypothetical protein